MKKRPFAFTLTLSLLIWASQSLASSVTVEPTKITIKKEMVSIHCDYFKYCPGLEVDIYYENNKILQVGQTYDEDVANLEVVRLQNILDEAKKSNHLVKVGRDWAFQDFIRVVKK